MPSTLTYVAYGSNMARERLLRYLPNLGMPGEYCWLPHRFYFAGSSKTWGGGVAFLGLQPEEAVPTLGRPYRMDVESLAHLASGENGLPVTVEDLAGLDVLEVGEHLLLHFVQADEFRGKYDAVLRLPDVDGGRTYTVTTARALQKAEPAVAYLDLIREALTAGLGEAGAEAYLRQRG